MLKVERRDGTPARRVLVGMIMSRHVLGPVADRWSGPGLFASPWENLVGGWAVEHYRKHGESPRNGIESYFERWAETARDGDVVAAVERFIAGLADESARLRASMSPDHVIDVANDVFEHVHLASIATRVSSHLAVGDVKKAREIVNASRAVEIGLGAGVNVLTDESLIHAAFDSRAEALVQYPDAVGNFFGPALGRDQFVALMGKEKVGKSYWLLDIAYRGVTQGRNVAYFEVGDMSQPQVLRRVASRVTGRPMDPGAYQYPVTIDPSADGKPARVEFEWRTERDGLTADDAVAAFRLLADDVGPERFKLSCHPNSSINVGGIETIVQTWARDGWRPDVIVIDYADILAPMPGADEVRDQINANWKAMRAMSQRHHCLVVTATQTDANSYGAKILRRENFSEDKRKYAHVTGMVGLNQTDAEKERGVYRLNWVVRRELAFAETKCVHVASCLPLGNPCVCSLFD